MSKFPPNEMQVKRKRNEEIKKLYASGKYTYEDLGKMFAISKQRVEQILVALDKS